METYQGSANYPTWAMDLFLSNDSDSYHQVEDKAYELRDVDMLAQWLESTYYITTDGYSAYGDIIAWAMGMIAGQDQTIDNTPISPTYLESSLTRYSLFLPYRMQVPIYAGD